MNDQTETRALSLSPPRQMSPALNVGAVTIETERAIAEVQGELILAKRFPRDVTSAIAEFSESCRNVEFAAKAFYSVPNRGNGTSIRFAEEAARCYGNFSFGHRELSRDEGKSEVEVWAWDKERNNRSVRQITVMHVTDTKNGPKVLRDQTDIDNKIANVASKQVRGRIQALLPKHMLAIGEAIAKQTLSGGSEKTLTQNVQAMVAAFGNIGVKPERIKQYLGHKIDDVDADELAELRGVYNAIKEGAKIADYFKSGEDEDSGEQSDQAAAIAAAAKAGAAAAKAQPPAAKETPKEQPKSPPPPPPPPPAPPPPPPPAPEPEPEPDAGPNPPPDDLF